MDSYVPEKINFSYLKSGDINTNVTLANKAMNDLNIPEYILADDVVKHKNKIDEKTLLTQLSEAKNVLDKFTINVTNNENNTEIDETEIDYMALHLKFYDIKNDIVTLFHHSMYLSCPLEKAFTVISYDHNEDPMQFHFQLYHWIDKYSNKDFDSFGKITREDAFSIYKIAKMLKNIDRTIIDYIHFDFFLKILILYVRDQIPAIQKACDQLLQLYNKIDDCPIKNKKY